MRGNRVKNVVRELHNEKIDIIPFSQDPVELLQNALSPIEIRKININEDDHTISIVVEDDDFAAVIGKKGMNARLNSQLIEYELEVQKMSDYNRALSLQRLELAASDDQSFDEPLTGIEGINTLIFEHLVERWEAAGKTLTFRSLITMSPAELAAVPGISLDMALKILEQLRKQRT